MHKLSINKFFLVLKSTSPFLLVIRGFDRIARLYNRHLNSNTEYAYANDFEVRQKALIDLAKLKRLDGLGLIMGGINFA